MGKEGFSDGWSPTHVGDGFPLFLNAFEKLGKGQFAFAEDPPSFGFSKSEV